MLACYGWHARYQYFNEARALFEYPSCGYCFLFTSFGSFLCSNPLK